LEYKVDSSAIHQLKDKIDRKAFLVIKDSSKVQLFHNYINRHTDSKFLPDAIAKRNHLEFEKVKQKNTSMAYRGFYMTYPDAKEAREARNRYEERLFIEHTSEGRPADYNYFIKNYPESPYVNAALDSVYAYYARYENREKYHQFIKENPKHPKVNQAWRRIYALYTAKYSPEKIIEFRIEYPDYPFLDELKQDIRLAAKEFLPFQANGKWGFMDRTGKVMIPAHYQYVEPFSEGLALVIKDDKLGFIDKAGKVMIPIEYQDGESFIDGTAIVSKSGQFGMINRNNKVIIPLKYELVGRFYSSLALVANETHYGYVDREGRELIPLKLDYGTDFKNGFAVVEIDGKKGIINTKGKLVVPAKYSWLESFNQYGLARAKNDSLYGLLNQNGSEQLHFEYDRIGEFSKGLSLITAKGKYGYIDRIGKMKIPMDFDFVPEAMVWGKFEQGFTKFFLNGKYGIIDSSGTKVFPAIFEDIKMYSPNRFVAVKKRGKWGYTNDELKLVIPYRFDEAFTFQGEYGVVKLDQQYGIIDEGGKFVIEPQYTSINPFSAVGYVLDSLGTKGFLKSDLTFGLNLSYDQITPSADFKGLLEIKEGNSTYYYDPKSEKLIKPLEYPVK